VRHSILRVHQKHFHHFSTQVKLVLACCILLNWILRWRIDEFLDEDDVTPDGIDYGHCVSEGDSQALEEQEVEVG
jgi:hypothetical protein